ncbi:MAG: ATP-binding protein [Rhodospirillales bacterium]|nr:ATP-binding protein [Rhodospirillales bacterium]
MHQITDPEIKKRLAFDNPWWESGEVDARFRNWPRRAYFEGFVQLVAESRVERAVVLMGPRRVGKTVMIHQAIQHLLDKKISATRILYVSVDTPVYTGTALEQIVRLFQETHRHKRKTKLHVFFDEIQYQKDWERHLKSLVDSYPHIRFLVSGSAAAALKLKSLESGAGRFTDFILPTLTFTEFLKFQGIAEPKFIEEADGSVLDIGDVNKLNTAFIDYLNFGGFPESVFKKEVRESMDRYVADDIIDKVLLRDLPSLYGISDTQELNRLFTTIAYNTGQEVSVDELSKSSQVAKNTIKKYLEYLEAAFLIRRIYRVDRNARRFKKQSQFKVYLANPSFRSALFGKVQNEDPAIGKLAETAIVSQYAHSHLFRDLHYARWKKGEVDLVGLDPVTQKSAFAIEIKWSDRALEKPFQELRATIRFCQRNKLDQLTVSTKTRSRQETIDGIKIYFLPLSSLCWLIARQYVDSELSWGWHPMTGPLTMETIPARLKQRSR